MATLVEPHQAPSNAEQTRRHYGWNVVVWNDPVTLMSYVVLVLRKLFGHNHHTATQLMLQIHNEGKAIVATQPREQAETSVASLHTFGLQATLAKPATDS